MSRRPRLLRPRHGGVAVNRALLALAGALLLVAGLLALAGGFDLYHRLGLAVPHGWPLRTPHRPVLGDATRARLVAESWWWPVAIAGPALVLAGSLGWLFVQLRRSGPAGIDLSTPADGHFALRVRGRALEEALETETAALPDVDDAIVHLVGAPHRPQVRATVRLTPRGGAAELVELFHAGPLERARVSLGLAELPAELQVRVAAPGTPAPPRHPHLS